MIYSWISILWRRFKRDKLNALINVFGLTLGILVFLVIFTYVHHEISYDKFHKNKDQIFRLLKSNSPSDRDYGGISTQAVFPGPLAEILKSEIAGIESVARLGRNGILVAEVDGKTFFEDQHYASDHDIFEVLTFEILAGSNSSALSYPMTVALSETTALKYFGTVDVLGKTIDFTNFRKLGTYKVDAVFKDLPSNSSFNFNIIIRFEDFVKAVQPGDLTNWNNWNYNYFLKTVKDVNIEIVQESILNYFKENRPDDFKPDHRYTLEPVAKMYLNPRVNFAINPRGDVNKLYLLSAIAVLVLVIAIINYINLTTARSLLRAKEVGVRKATGATRSELITQFLGDAWIISVVAVVIAIGSLKLFWPVFTSSVDKDIPLNLLADKIVLTGILVSPFVLSLAAGLYPAIYLSSFNPVKVLKGTFARSQQGTFSRDLLITVQFMISGGLVIAVLIINDQLNYIQTNDPGYSREHIISVPLTDEGVRDKKEIFQSDLTMNSSIISASLSTSLPHAVGMVQSRLWKTNEEKVDVSFYTILADYNFLSLYNIKLIEGRNFSPNIKTDRNSFIINETAAQQYGWNNPVGMQFIEESGDTVRIIGLMKDIHFSSYRDLIKPLRIGLINTYVSQMSILVSDHDLGSTLTYIESCYKKLATTKLPYVYNFFDEQYDKIYNKDYQLNRLIFTFSIIAVLIAALGLYSISIHAVSLRLKEIGVRKVFGAEVKQIMLILSRKFVFLVIVAFFLITPIAYYIMSEWLNTFAYHVSVNSLPFLFALLFIFVVSILTISINILKAAQSNPVDVLRSE